MDTVRKGIKGIRGILFNEQNRILTAATTLMVLTLLTKFSGMLFTALLAQKFGASRPTDILNAANSIPDMITMVILVGAVSGAMIPILIKSKINESKADFIRFFNTLLNIGLIAFLIISGLIIIFSHTIVDFAVSTKIINPVDPFTPEELREIGSIMRYLMFPQAILGISTFVSSALNVHERFTIPSLSPLFYNLGRIFGVFIIVDMLNGSVMGVVWGSFLGAIMHLAIQLPLMIHLEIRYSFVIDLKSKYLKDVIKLGLPRIFSLAGEQVNSTISDIIAISLNIGSLSALNYGLSLIAIPLSLFGLSFAVASFPSLSKFYEQGDMRSFSRLFRKVVNQIFFLAVPAAAIIFVLRIPLTRLFFGILGGEFNWEDTRQVAWVIFFFSFGLPFETLRSFMYRVFYSIHDSTKPLIISIIVMFIGVLCSIGFTNYFSHYSSFKISDMANDVIFITYNRKDEFPFASDIKPNSDFFNKFVERSNGENAVGGLALAATFVFTFEFILLAIFLRQKHVIDNLNNIIVDFAKKLTAGLSSIMLGYFLFKFWENILNTTKTLNLMFLTGSTTFAVVMFYLWVSYILKIPEVNFFLDYLATYWYKMEKKVKILRKFRELI